MENDSFSKDVNIEINKALAESKFFFVSIYILETKFIYVDHDQITVSPFPFSSFLEQYTWKAFCAKKGNLLKF